MPLVGRETSRGVHRIAAHESALDLPGRQYEQAAMRRRERSSRDPYRLCSTGWKPVPQIMWVPQMM